jgi:hypothetical protein
MLLTDILILAFIVFCFAAFIVTLAWASHPPRRSTKRSVRPVQSAFGGPSGPYSIPH